MDATPKLGIEGLVDAEEVGRGGFAVVYRARQPAFGRVVAVKILNASPDPNSLARFQREIQAMGQLSEHPYIATVLDAGTTANGQLYLLMPFLSGGSLADAVEGGIAFGAREAAEIGVKLAGALQAAHDTGILHRDIKPANVMLGRFGDPLMVDFGIARIAGGHQTTTGVVTATLNHAAPELLDGHPPTVASDIYALGSTLYTLIAGRAPFASTTDQSVVPLISRIAMQPLPPLATGSEIQPVLDRAMAKDPAGRYASMDEMATALAEVVAGRPLGPVTPPVPVGASVRDDHGSSWSGVEDTARVEILQGSTAAPVEGGTGSRRWLVVASAVAGILVLVVAAALFRGGDGGDGADVTATDPDVASGASIDLESLPVVGLDESDTMLLADPVESIPVEPGSITDVSLPQGGSVSLSFSASGNQALRFVAISIGDEDPLAGLYRDGVLLAADDDSGGDGNVLLDYPTLPEGDYEIRMTDLSGDGMVSASLQLPDVRDLGEGETDELTDLHQVHAYSVTVDVGSARGVLVTTDGAQMALRALNTDGFVVQENSGTEQVPLDLTDAGPGTFLVFVAAPDGQAQYDIAPLRQQIIQALPAIGESLLNRDGLPQPADADRELEPFETHIVDLALGEVLSAPFTVDADMTPVRVLARSPDGEIDALALLYRSDGTWIGGSDDEGFGFAGTDAIIDQVLPAGDYVAVFADLDQDSEGQLDLMTAQVEQVQPLEDGVSGDLRGPDLPDVYVIAVRPGQPPPAIVSVQADFDARLRLVDGDGLIEVSTDEGGNPPVELSGLGVGVHHLYVSAPEAGGYTLNTPN